jgi:hypothetical protein
MEKCADVFLPDGNKHPYKTEAPVKDITMLDKDVIRITFNNGGELTYSGMRFMYREEKK